MQALSRNTASVAQDFRSAGGDNFITNAMQQHIKGNITLTSVNRDAPEQNGAIGNQQKKKTKAMSPIDHSPPAVILKTGGLTSDGSNNKRRRKMSPFNDKENVNELLIKQLTFLKQQHMIFLKNLNESVMSDSERLKTVQEINEIFETMYNNSLSLISSIESDKRPKVQQLMSSACKDETGRYNLPEFLANNIKLEPKDDDDKLNMPELLAITMEPKDDNCKYNLPDFLTNNNEITVIMEPKLRLQLEQHESRKNRKQLKPKKIEKLLEAGTSRNILSDLRDKHMVCLVTRRKSCFTCRNKSSDANSFFNKTSLLLHKLWRHSTTRFECHHCQMKFNQIYKLRLHKKLKKH